MIFTDLREFIALLESKGQLRRVGTPVSAELEITEICQRVIGQGGPALLFEHVAGYDIPVLGNLFGTHQRVAWALGVERLEEIAGRLRSVLGMAQGGPPEGFVPKLRALGDLVRLASYRPRTVRDAPCQEVVLRGEEVDLSTLPVVKCWPLDGGRFITLPLVISHDPRTGARNVGTYRMQVYDERTTGMHWQTHKVGAEHWRSATGEQWPRMPVAVALGADPATMWSGSAPLPPGVDEFMFAGFLRDEPVQLVRAKTIDVEVPAHAEIVLEGYMTPGELRKEGPFGDHTGYYSLEDDYPVFHVTALTRRRRPIYPNAIVGRPPQEDYFMGKATERLFLPMVQMVLPEIADMNMPAEGIFQNLVIVSIRKEYPGHAQKVMHALWGLGLLMLSKTIIVVDHWVDVQDLSEVAWRVTMNIAPAQDLHLVTGPIDDLDHSTPTPRLGSKVGVDATEKGSLEGRARPWPPEIAMSDEVKALVDRKWKQYGI